MTRIILKQIVDLQRRHRSTNLKKIIPARVKQKMEMIRQWRPLVMEMDLELAANITCALSILVGLLLLRMTFLRTAKMNYLSPNIKVKLKMTKKVKDS